MTVRLSVLLENSAPILSSFSRRSTRYLRDDISRFIAGLQIFRVRIGAAVTMYSNGGILPRLPLRPHLPDKGITKI